MKKSRVNWQGITWAACAIFTVLFWFVLWSVLEPALRGAWLLAKSPGFDIIVICTAFILFVVYVFDKEGR